MVFVLACGGAPDGEPAGGGSPGSTSRPDGVADGVAGGEAEQPLGPGFVVWESNRDGGWGIWIRDLEGGAPRRLSPEEPGRDHCCPHVSPDGGRVAYLSGVGGAQEYPRGGTLGALHLIAPDGSGDRVVAPAARSYFENRAVVWRSAGELIHIDGERATVALDLATGGSRRLSDPPPERGWLIDPTLAWATTGVPEFAPYDAARRTVLPRRELGGCQPYFSRDGRWGFWTAGAGGPIDRLELATGRVGRILEKSDPRVPGGHGYAYFPMLSADGRLFAWAASRGGHPHFGADYEVFVAESDPDTLELLGPPRRITRHPGTDRFPDVWQPPLGLGRHAGEAPLTVRLSAPAAGDWRWSFSDGGAAEGVAVEHTWSGPGRYEVLARRDGEALRGLAVVHPAAPPRAVSATARAGGTELIVAFDEEIDGAGADLALASGGEIAGREVGADGRSLVVRLAEPLAAPDRLAISGVRDRAQRANLMAPATLAIDPPAWPVSRDGLVFVWESADAANLVPDPELGADRAYTLTARGEARLDAGFAMIATGGSFVLERGEAERIGAALQARNQFTLEATIESEGADGPIVTWGSQKAPNLWLAQRSGRLVFGLRTGARGPAAYPRLELLDLPAGAPVHLVLTYEPGRLAAYLDGEPRFETADLQGDLFHWQPSPLAFGGAGWRGRLEGVALYDRVLGPGEAREAHRLDLAKRRARPPVPRSVVEARLVARSATPTLEEISPYREALFTVAYAVDRQLAGPPLPARLRAVQWAILDSVPLAVNRAAAGDRFRLTLEPFARQPQLEPVYLADTLDAAPAGTADGPPGELLYVVETIPVD